MRQLYSKYVNIYLILNMWTVPTHSPTELLQHRTVLILEDLKLSNYVFRSAKLPFPFFPFTCKCLDFTHENAYGKWILSSHTCRYHMLNWEVLSALKVVSCTWNLFETGFEQRFPSFKTPSNEDIKGISTPYFWHFWEGVFSSSHVWNPQIVSLPNFKVWQVGRVCFCVSLRTLESVHPDNEFYIHYFSPFKTGILVKTSVDQKAKGIAHLLPLLERVKVLVHSLIPPHHIDHLCPLWEQKHTHVNFMGTPLTELELQNAKYQLCLHNT